MNGEKSRISLIFAIMKWTARIGGSIFALFLLLMLVAHLVNPDGGKSVQDSPPGAVIVLIFSLWIAGVGLAWKWEGIGGLIILIGSVIFFILNPHDIWPPLLLHMMPVASALFLACWIKSLWNRSVESAG